MRRWPTSTTQKPIRFNYIATIQGKSLQLGLLDASNGGLIAGILMLSQKDYFQRVKVRPGTGHEVPEGG